MGKPINSIAILLQKGEIAILKYEKGFNLTDQFKVGRVFNRFALSPNPTLPFLLYSDDIVRGTVKLYHMENKSLKSFCAHLSPIIIMAISTDGRMVATASCNV